MVNPDGRISVRTLLGSLGVACDGCDGQEDDNKYRDLCTKMEENVIVNPLQSFILKDDLTNKWKLPSFWMCWVKKV
jgi:hypothetical protein